MFLGSEQVGSFNVNGLYTDLSWFILISSLVAQLPIKFKLIYNKLDVSSGSFLALSNVVLSA